MSLYAWIERDPGGRLGHGTLVERDDEADLDCLRAYHLETAAYNRRRDAEEKAAAEASVMEAGSYCQGDDWEWAWYAPIRDLLDWHDYPLDAFEEVGELQSELVSYMQNRVHGYSFIPYEEIERRHRRWRFERRERHQ